MDTNKRKQIAFIDLEFNSVYGSKKNTIPQEVGITCYDEYCDSVCYSGKKFTYDIDVEMWTSTDKYGNQIKPECSVANIKKGEYNKPRDKHYRLNDEQKIKAYNIERCAHQELGTYVNFVLEKSNAEKLVFFDDHMDIRILKNAEIELEKYICIDVQKEIKRRCGIEQGLSLHKISQAINFHTTEKSIKSSNFEYDIPSKFKPAIDLHMALGDSARTFLVYNEFKQDQNAFKETIESHLFRL